MRTNHALCGALLTLQLTTGGLFAQNAPNAANSLAPADGVKAQDTAPVIDKKNSFWQQDFLTGDWGGARTKLSDKGVSFGLNYIGEVFGNPSGGVSQGTVLNGRIEMALDIDFKALVGLEGGSFHANSYYIYGQDLSASRVGNIFTVSNIAAYNTLRLFDLWYQQELFKGMLSIRAGQIAADDEFIVSEYGATFINGTFGWPAMVSANLASGGPGYPLATPGVRVMVTPIPQLSLMAAVFDGDPGDNGINAQAKDSTGTRIDFAQGSLSMYEADYRLNQEDNAKGLPGTYKLGGWYATENYANISTGLPSNDDGNWGIYFVADQMVWRKPTVDSGKHDPKDMKAVADKGAPSDQGLGLFWRVGGSPQDRNLLNFYTDGGLNFKGLIPGRDEDVLGLGVAYGSISNDLSNAERNAGDTVIQNHEVVVELTYQAKITPFWSVQPDFQYILQPGGHTPDPNNINQPIPNAVVLGVRTTVNF